MTISRRGFFTMSSAGVAGLAATATLSGSSIRSTLAAASGLKHRVGGRTGTIGSPNLPESIEKAKSLGLDGVEIEANSGGKPGETLQCFDTALQKRYRAAVEEQGVSVASICMGHCNEFPVFSDPRVPGWIRGTIDAAAALDARTILVPFFWHGDLRIEGQQKMDPEKAGKTIEVIKSVARHAEDKGVVLGLENTLGADDNMRLVEAIDSPAVKVYYDIGNSTYIGGYDAAKEIRRLGRERIAQVHFKDGDNLLGRGKVDMAAVRDSMNAIGYEGWIILETAKPLGAEVSAAYNAGFIRGLFSS